MTTRQLIRKFYRINVQLYKFAKYPLRSHGPDHHARVCAYALRIARRYRVDKEILIAACFLHDLAAYDPRHVGDRYHEEDAPRAEKVLRRIRFPKEKISNVLGIIAHHGSDRKYRRAHEPIEMTIVRDADKLDAFGPLGVARILMVRTLRGDTLQDIVHDFYYGKHLERKWKSIRTPEAKKIGWKQYVYARNFFKSLTQKLREQST